MRKYSLQRKSYIQVVSENFKDTLKSFGCLVGCSSATGIFLAQLHNMELAGYKYDIESDLRFIPIATFCASLYFAKEVYSNFKKDRARVKQLAEEIRQQQLQEKQEQQEALKTFTKPEDLFDFESQFRSKIIEFPTMNDGGNSSGKRKSLTTGHFSDE